MSSATCFGRSQNISMRPIHNNAVIAFTMETDQWLPIPGASFRMGFYSTCKLSGNFNWLLYSSVCHNFTEWEWEQFQAVAKVNYFQMKFWRKKFCGRLFPCRWSWSTTLRFTLFLCNNFPIWFRPITFPFKPSCLYHWKKVIRSVWT